MTPFGSRGSSQMSFIAVELINLEIKFVGALPGSVLI